MDLDGDDDPPVLLASELLAYEAKANSFKDAISVDVPFETTQLYHADLDGDRDADLITAGISFATSVGNSRMPV